MLASVFFMQPLGQIAGNLVTLVVVAVTRGQGEADVTRAVDIMWRWVIGIGVVPGVIASLFRFAIPETPRYLLEIDNDPIKAEFDATTLFGESQIGPEEDPGVWMGAKPPSSTMSQASGSIDEDTLNTNTEYTLHPPTLQSHWPLAQADIIHYFWTEGNWRTLLGTSLAWLLLDFGFYGIGLSSPQFLAKTWGSLDLSGVGPPWETNDKGASLFSQFFDTSIHAMVILNTGSFIGGLLLICFSYRLNRVSLQKYGFLVLAALFIALGTMFITVQKEGPVAVVLYVIGQLLFNFGRFKQRRGVWGGATC
jgi:PHS family inorganic phosphate transporter-like MFS transporter